MNDMHKSLFAFYLVVLNFEGPKHKKSQKYQHIYIEMSNCKVLNNAGDLYEHPGKQTPLCI